MSKVAWFFLSLASVVLIAFIDWVTGDAFSFFTFYFFSVSIAAWYLGFKESIGVSFISVFAWFFVDYLLGHPHTDSLSTVWNNTVRCAAFVIIGFATAKIRTLLTKERNLTSQLSKAIAEIKVLQSFLSICCVCKKIRTENGEWQQIESYISQHSDTRFSHGYCPVCLEKAMKEAELS